MEKRKSPPPIREVRTPAFTPPSGSCDCHVHLIGPQSVYPLAPNCPVELEDSTFEDFQKVQAALGVPRALIVASGGHGFDYQHVLHALCRDPENYRGVTFLPPDVTDRELFILDANGMVGARFFPQVCAPDSRALGRIHELGWSAHFMIANADQFDLWTSMIESFPGPIVLEHSGGVNPADGTESAHFNKILRLLDSGRCWIKLSPKFSKMPLPPFEDTLPIIRRLIAHRPDRMLYSSDYPHPQHYHPMPNEADLLDLMLLWAPDPDVRTLIMARNAEALFGFPPAG